MASALPNQRGILATDMVYFRELSELAGSGGDLRTFFDRIVAVVSDIMDAQIVSLMLVNERFNTLWIVAARGLEEDILRTSSVRVGEGISGRVAKEGKPLLIRDVEVEPSTLIEKSSNKYNTKGLMSVPIRIRNKVIGVLNVNNKRTGLPFDASDLNLLVVLSNQAGLAIDNARLFADLQSKAQSLERANPELKRINKAKTDLIVNLSHEIKTPLTAIIGYVDLLIGGALEDKEKIMGFLSKISMRGRDLNRMVERIITFFALQTDSVDWILEEVQLTKLVYEVVDKLQNLARERNVEIEVNGPSLSYNIWVDLPQFQEVFRNMIENAILFNRSGGKVMIYGEAVSRGSRSVQVHVSDTGHGVPDSLTPKIFDGFVQTENLLRDKPEGLGIGLAMSRAIVEGHHGTLKLTANSPNGATFTVTLPLK